MKTSQKIELLRKEIAELEVKQEVKGKEFFRFLIGKYLHRSATSWEKVIAINRVNDDGEITFDCVAIFYDEKDNRVQDCSVANRSWGSIAKDDIKRYEITKDKFEEIFLKAVARITEEL